MEEGIRWLVSGPGSGRGRRRSPAALGFGVGEASMGTRPRGMAGVAAIPAVGLVRVRNSGRRWCCPPWWWRMAVEKGRRRGQAMDSEAGGQHSGEIVDGVGTGCGRRVVGREARAPLAWAMVVVAGTRKWRI
jgi:hypothetical protein